MMINKTKRWTCKQYTDWVKTLPSCSSLMPADDPHHITGILQSGTAIKLHDIFTMPLTRAEHTLIHNGSKVVNAYDVELNQSEEVIRTINQAINEGLIEIKWIGDKVS